MSVLALPALRAAQNSHVMFLVSIPAAKLTELNLKVERFDSTLVERFRSGQISKEQYLAMQGYQRSVENNRANKFAAYLQNDAAISPTVLLINDRDGACTYDEKSAMLSFDLKSPLYIYDGQHRDKGIEKALLNKAELADFPIFAVITFQLPKLKEMAQFKVINGTAKGVKTNLVIEIMTAIQTDETEVSAKEAKEIACNHAAHEINRRDDSPWRGMVALANTTKPKKSEIRVNPELETQRIMGSQSFLRSLQWVYDYLEANKWPRVSGGMLKTPTSLLERGKKIADIAVEFWNAVKRQMPEPFETPNNYVLHSAIGVNAMHGVLTSLLGDMYKGRRDWACDEFVTMTRGSSWFTNADDWDKESGEAANYGGYGGIDKLTALILDSVSSSSVAALQ
jgi:DGQHR domain-containing protein